LIGINNRDLRSFKTDLEHTLRLRDRVPDECVLVSESGIRTRADVERLRAAGVDAVAVATHLRAAVTALDDLIGVVTPDDVLDRVFGAFCVGK